jgi:flagellar assembly protein FliH
MCNVIKLQNKKKNFQLKVSSGVEEVYTNFASDEELKARELKAEYEKGYNDAVEDLKEKIKKEFEAKLQNEADKFQNILKAIDNELTNYEERFSEMVVTIALEMSKKILNREIDENSPILKNISSVSQKLIGANHLIVKSHPDEIELLKENAHNLFAEGNFSKIKFESDDRIEKGGFIIESDIGNIDGKISSQLNEIKKAIGNISSMAEEK